MAPNEPHLLLSMTLCSSLPSWLCDHVTCSDQWGISECAILRSLIGTCTVGFVYLEHSLSEASSMAVKQLRLDYRWWEATRRETLGLRGHLRHPVHSQAPNWMRNYRSNHPAKPSQPTKLWQMISHCCFKWPNFGRVFLHKCQVLNLH